MNLKAALLLSLVFFTATMVISATNLTTISLTLSKNAFMANNVSTLQTGLVGSLGDPIADPADPK
jgi:hypothetical protein